LAFLGGFLIDFAPFFMVLLKRIFWIKIIEYILWRKADSLFLPDKVMTVPENDKKWTMAFVPSASAESVLNQLILF